MQGNERMAECIRASKDNESVTHANERVSEAAPVRDEAAHEKRNKDTDNFLVTV
jgi:hypothetical protein